MEDPYAAIPQRRLAYSLLTREEPGEPRLLGFLERRAERDALERLSEDAGAAGKSAAPDRNQRYAPLIFSSLAAVPPRMLTRSASVSSGVLRIWLTVFASQGNG